MNPLEVIASAEPLSPKREQGIEPASLARASGSKEYWRSPEEWADTPEFRAFVEREYPQHVHDLGDPISRRRFLALMGASLALAGLNGCGTRQPPEKWVPYVRLPVAITPGKPLYFATAMPQPGGAIGLLVESHQGRPTKIEGNPQHPSSMGATDVYAQASVLGLYDPDRSQAVTYLGRIRGWDDAVAPMQKAVREKVQPNHGARFRILTESVNSPSLAGQIEELLKTYRDAKWYQYEPAVSGNGRAGARQAFGEPLDVRYDFSAADVVVTLDADVFGSGPGNVRYARDFASRRRPAQASDAMNRHYAIESTPTPAGMAADHRLPLRASEIEPFARDLAAELELAGIRRDAQQSANARWVSEIAKDLTAHAGRGIVIGGADQPPALHALVHAINDKLGNIGKTVFLTQPVGFRAGDDPLRSLRDLADDMERGLDVLLILGGNPVFTAPADLNFAERMQKVPLRIHLGLYDDETARQCHWHIPAAHFLESWGDALGHDGTASIIQPLIAPLYAGRSALEVLTVFSGQPNRPTYDIVRAHWRKFWDEKKPGGSFDTFWRKSVHDGVVAGTAFEPKTVTVKGNWQVPSERRPSASAGEYEIIFRPDPTILDGRYANNPWLQELPKPLTRLTWDNAALVSPATGQALGLANAFGPHGGTHGELIANTAKLSFAGRTLDNVPVVILPGHPDQSVTLHYGYGRSVAGKVGSDIGSNAYTLRHTGAMAFGNGLRIEKTGRRVTLACTQFHHMLEDRAGRIEAAARGQGLVRAATLEEFRKALAREPAESGRPAAESWPHAESDGPLPVVGVRQQKTPQIGRKPLDMYPEVYPYDGYKWGMVIDLSACTGCNSCVVACQAENNIPVVGKDQVIRGREMHWLRIDQYFRGDPAAPEAFFQPMACVHCENAPCEVVCPVEATSHSPDGLNEMTYNRCVGTRYCSNNCPYKVRRFNFFLYADYATASLKSQRNPEVTVRSRGVMEKCTFCVQRIRNAEIEAKNQNRYGEDASRPQVAFVRDGEIVTACQAACPSQAIIFGDMNDVRSRVAAQKQNPRHFGVLTDLNTRPRLTYLAPVRNPSSALNSDRSRGI
jgi:molybdopterin-containing oxidoreductase family iron-sulfur binding subunit